MDMNHQLNQEDVVEMDVADPFDGANELDGDGVQAVQEDGGVNVVALVVDNVKDINNVPWMSDLPPPPPAKRRNRSEDKTGPGGKDEDLPGLGHVKPKRKKERSSLKKHITFNSLLSLYNPGGYNIGQGVPVKVMFVEETSAVFYALPLSSVDGLDGMNNRIQALIESNANDSSTSSCVDNQLVIALYSADEQSYRAVVLQAGFTESYVHFVDFGNKAFVKNTNIKPMPPMIVQYPVETLKLRLHGSRLSGQILDKNFHFFVQEGETWMVRPTLSTGKFHSNDMEEFEVDMWQPPETDQVLMSNAPTASTYFGHIDKPPPRMNQPSGVTDELAYRLSTERWPSYDSDATDVDEAQPMDLMQAVLANTTANR